ncbi:four helix bundle protein [Thiobacillus sp.]|jgi:four helix bundle protein|uniref:four helix bundle protein n=1 Tax=Thiobacillus sp. TaxID=924 RepID=UPI0025D6565D|nr:four helix bundle protein [Thiobacillus sp.]
MKKGGKVGSKPHEQLEAWRKSMELVEEIYRMTSNFPAQEQYGLVSQMRRAAVSIPSNLAEGAARDGNREFARFLSIARGSLSELDTQCQIAMRLGYFKQGQGQAEILLERVGKLVSGLHKKVKETE